MNFEQTAGAGFGYGTGCLAILAAHLAAIVSAKRTPTRSANTPSAPLSNRLLTALPRADQDRLRSILDVVALPVKQILHRPGGPIDYVYFPTLGFCSELTVLESGAMVEVATVGGEGMVGIFAIDDAEPAPSVSMVQAAMDGCYRLPAERFREEMNRGGAFRALMNRYLQAHVGSIMQSTACNAIHTMEQRLARWLLMAQDRVGSNAFPLTQEFVAMMLGVSRPAVTIVAGTLQAAGLITYRRGHVAILDRERLEAASCECYRVVTRLLASVTRSPGSRVAAAETC